MYGFFKRRSHEVFQAVSGRLLFVSMIIILVVATNDVKLSTNTYFTVIYAIVAATKGQTQGGVRLKMPIFIKESMPIKWRLAVLMADREIDYKELAEMTGMHPVTISKHKNIRVMPERLERETLEKYCKALNCQPGDLLTYVPDEPKGQTS